MRNLFYLVILLLFPVAVPAQPETGASLAQPFVPTVKTFFYAIGDTRVRISLYQYGKNKDLFFIHLHDDEITAVSAAKRLLAANGGTLLKIENDKQRNLHFRLSGKSYSFDPNRIFSRTGIIQTLGRNRQPDITAVNEVDKFSRYLLRLLPAKAACIIALHNNTPGHYSITSYLAGHERHKDARAVHIRPGQDPDDLFLTTDSALFRKLTKEKYNVVLQDNRNAIQDGSLSVYCGEKNICYLNCETEHGRLEQYVQMISAAIRHTGKSSPGTVIYRYRLTPSEDSTQFSRPFGIYFGEKKVGSIQPEEGEDAGNTTGQMIILKTFPLYDNMDLYYFKSGNRDNRIELRIDPTRAKKIYDPGKAVIVIKVVP